MKTKTIQTHIILIINSGYFNGKSHCTSTFTSTSDSIFKENVHYLTGDSALFIITHLAAKTYVFDSIDYPTIHLPRGGQYGLIAQQVERVAPTLVSEIQHPAFYDTLGHIIDSAITYKALNYTGLIPILVAAVKLLSTHASTTDNGVSIGSSNDIELGGTALKHTTEIPMIDPASDKEYNIYFSGQSSMHNAKANIGIGYDTTYALEAKLDVISHTDQYSENNFTNTYTGRFLNEGIYRSTANKDFIAVYGKTDIDKADSKVANTNIGGDFIARNGNVNIGVRGSTDGTYKPNTTNYGVYGESMDTVNYWAGYFNGFIGTTAGWVQASDRRLKQDIQVISKTSSMELINKLHPKTYRFNAASAKGMNMPNGKQYGLIADEVKKELPELVKAMSTPAKYDAKGKLINEEQHFEGVNYSALIPLLIAAVQSLDSTNKELRSELKDLRNCCGYSTSVTPTNKGNHTSLELADLAIILDQNSPNPFAEQTIITYTIPETVSTAKLVFYTSSGIVMKEYTMQEKGSGSMAVYASNLSAGIYSYSLIADGKLIATKKMICEKR